MLICGLKTFLRAEGIGKQLLVKRMTNAQSLYVSPHEGEHIESATGPGGIIAVAWFES